MNDVHPVKKVVQTQRDQASSGSPKDQTDDASLDDDVTTNDIKRKVFHGDVLDEMRVFFRCSVIFS